MAEENGFQDLLVSDSDDEDFDGYGPVDGDEVDYNDIPIPDWEGQVLNEDELLGIANEVENEARNAFVDAYESAWLSDFQSESGPKNFEDDASPYDIFCRFFDNEVLDLLVEQTNVYYDQFLVKKGGLDSLPKFSRARAWTPVTQPEMKVFLAIVIYQGLVRLPNYDMYWSTNELISLKNVASYMTRDRFLNILAFLHASDNAREPPRDDPQYDAGYKISKIASLLLGKWQAAYGLKREISVDETLIPFKGRTKLLQYMPNKPHKWGIKVWTLAEAKTGYIYNWQLYTGKAGPDAGKGLTHRVVTSLCQPLLGRGHHVYCDNFFTSPALFEELADNQTGACGTLRANRVGVPAQVG